MQLLPSAACITHEHMDILWVLSQKLLRFYGLGEVWDFKKVIESFSVQQPFLKKIIEIQ